MNIKEYSEALLAWSEIDDGSADDVLRRIVLMGNGMLYGAKTMGDLYQWHRSAWHQIGKGNQEIGMTMPIAAEEV